MTTTQHPGYPPVATPFNCGDGPRDESTHASDFRRHRADAEAAIGVPALVEAAGLPPPPRRSRLGRNRSGRVEVGDEEVAGRGRALGKARRGEECDGGSRASDRPFGG